MSFYVGGEVFGPYPEGNVCTAGAIELLGTLAEVVDDLFSQGGGFTH